MELQIFIFYGTYIMGRMLRDQTIRTSVQSCGFARTSGSIRAIMTCASLKVKGHMQQFFKGERCKNPVIFQLFLLMSY